MIRLNTAVTADLLLRLLTDPRPLPAPAGRVTRWIKWPRDAGVAAVFDHLRAPRVTRMLVISDFTLCPDALSLARGGDVDGLLR